MSVNRYKLRNFDNHHDDYQFPVSSLDYSFSNTLYDMNKGVTHDFLHSDKGHEDDSVRIVSDVEICMSQSPDITSRYPAEYRNNLRNSLEGMRSPVVHSGMTDDQLLNSHSVNGLELDERVAVTKSLADSLDSALSRLKPDIPSDTSAPADTSTSSDISTSE